ncbi:hypothetical protein SISNIDRAFT_413608, partial [Sistotremastrum niveocremeum HHB9708]
AQMHPYANIAWSVLSILEKQRKRDKAIDELVKVVDDTYVFIGESKDLFNVDPHRSAGDTLLKQATECGYFIQHYTQDEKFFKRTAKNIFRDIDAKVQEFKNNFAKLKLAFHEREAVQTELIVMKILEIVQNTGININLVGMPYLGKASFRPEKGCLSGTRSEILESVTQWVIRPISRGGGTLFWLTGFPGSGKSAIAHTIAARFSSGERLGGSFVFDQSDTDRQKAEAVFCKLSQDMMVLSSEWKLALGRAIERSPDLRQTPSVRRQFEELILRPSREMTFIGPILIVIDALDECGGDPTERAELFHILANRLSELPSNFRVFLTSRPEKEIVELFDGRSGIERLDLRTIPPGSVDHDIAIYYRSRLRSHLGELDAAWMGDEWVQELTERSEGLFQWAFTACEFLLVDGYDRVERLQSLLNNPELRGIDKLYKALLDRIFKITDESDGRLPQFRSVLGRVLCVRNPLPMSDLAALRGPDEKPAATMTFVRPMTVILNGTDSLEEPVKALHTSFRDFLFTRERSGMYHVDVRSQEDSLARACLTILNRELKFNISRSQTSYICLETPESDSHPEPITYIPGYLDYCSRFWSSHLVKASWTPDLKNLLHTFVKHNFLFWLELLSFTRQIYVARRSMRSLTEFTSGHDSELGNFGRDAEKFIDAFADVMLQSPPHIYISALPFAPEDSLVSQLYSPLFSRTLRITQNKQRSWTALERTFGQRGDMRSKEIKSMAYSPDGSILVLVTADFDVSFWDPETGQFLFTLLDDERHRPFNVDISPDGKYVGVGTIDGTITVWSLSNRTLIWGPTAVGEGSVECLRFSHDSQNLWAGTRSGYAGAWKADSGMTIVPVQPTTVAFSPDENRLAIGYVSGQVYLWDVKSGQHFAIASAEAKHENYVSSLCFSPDGGLLVSSSWDLQIRLWDGITGLPIGNPLATQGVGDRDVLVSPSGKYIACGANNGTVGVWDLASTFFTATSDLSIRRYKIETEAEIGTAMYGHSGQINHILLSPSGDQIASCSHDKTVRIWDPNTGLLLGVPLMGHTDEVFSVDFQQDGSRLLSCSRDKSIRIWDLGTWNLSGDPLLGHTDMVFCAKFYHEGRRIISGSYDCTVCIWDAKTSTMIGEPLATHQSPIWTIAISPAEDIVVSGSYNGEIILWDLNDSSLEGPRSIRHGQDIVRSLSFSADGKHILSASHDGTICLWEVQTGRMIGTPWERHGSGVAHAHFVNDGECILSSSYDGMVRVWDIESKRNGFDRTTELQESFPQIDDDGWVHSNGKLEERKLLFWIPPSHRSTFMWNRCRKLIGADSTIIDFSLFEHGENWLECYTPSSSSLEVIS